MRCFVDTDVLIWHLRGNTTACRFIQDLQRDPDNELWTGAMQRAEVMFHIRQGEEEGTLTFLHLFKIAAIDQRVVDVGARLYRQWRPSHGVVMNDCLLAATILVGGGKLYCLNVKHYPMPDLLVERAW
jgi:predicted nucleic acid-binding protein